MCVPAILRIIGAGAALTGTTAAAGTAAAAANAQLAIQRHTGSRSSYWRIRCS